MTRRADMELLGERLAEHAAHLDAAMHRFLADLRSFDEGQGWALQSAQTCAHWLAWRLGMDRGTAREHLRVAHRLAELPLVDDALRRGAISYSKIRAITRVAMPATEAVLLGMAERMTANQLETTCRKLRMTQRQPADPNESAERRFLSHRECDDGMTQITAILRPDEAARLFSVLDAIAAERTREQEAGGDVSAETRSPSDRIREQGHRVSAETRSPSDRKEPTRKIREHRFDRCDALVELAERHARGDQPARAAIDLVVTVSAAALVGDPAAPLDHVGAAADGTCLPLSTIRRLACDSGVIRAANANLGIREDTNMCRWNGADADYEAAIAELCRLEDLACEPDEWSRELGVSAETPSDHRNDDKSSSSAK